MEEKAALKKVTDLDDCADAYVLIAKNGSMTGQQITVGESKHLLFGNGVSLTRLDAGLLIGA